MALKARLDGYYLKDCSCGWSFLTLKPFTAKCPQCRQKSRIKICVDCGCEYPSRSKNSLYCPECYVVYNAVTIRTAKEMNKRHSFQRADDERKVGEILIDFLGCSGDCLNCEHEDCILPED